MVVCVSAFISVPCRCYVGTRAFPPLFPSFLCGAQAAAAHQAAAARFFSVSFLNVGTPPQKLHNADAKRGGGVPVVHPATPTRRKTQHNKPNTRIVVPASSRQSFINSIVPRNPNQTPSHPQSPTPTPKRNKKFGCRRCQLAHTKASSVSLPLPPSLASPEPQKGSSTSSLSSRWMSRSP